MEKISIIWFRNDLRLHDNEAILDAMSRAEKVLPIYVFDERIFRGKTSFGFDKCSKFRTKFIIEAVSDLRENLRKVGSELIIRIGKPEDEVFEIAKLVKSSWVYCNRERTDEEVKVQDKLEKNLWTIGQELLFVRGKMLYHTADLPFPVSQVPDVFTQYRKEVEHTVAVRPPLDSPAEITTVDINIEVGEIPTLAYFDKDDKFSEVHIENQNFIGGETYALQQLNYYIWGTNLINEYKETRNEMLGWDYSSKFSAWLSLGCLSPKYIYHQLKAYESDVCKNESTYWMYFELLWRDFFRLQGKKYGNRIFNKLGIKGKSVHSFDRPDDRFESWAAGNTGLPIIDANMRQLNQTGFMSNRGRQNVASFLVHDLKVNWLMGAEYFESLLIDYDPCSNYGNWNYLAGVGADPREERYFNIISQSKRYDAQGSFIRYWIPELSRVPNSFIHQPDAMDIAAQSEAGLLIGKAYPTPIVESKIWV
jgi:deoxyribodipyrimidine photo-lyase